MAVGEFAHEARHVGRFEVKAGGRERIRETGVRVGGDEGVGGFFRELGEEGPHEVGADGAIETDGERMVAADGVPHGLDSLGGDHGFAAETDGGGDHEREPNIVLGEDLLDGDEGGLGVERIEDGFNEEEVGAAGDEGANLAAVVGLDLIEGDNTKTGVVGVGGVGERYGERPDGASDVAAAAGGVGDAVGPLAALARRLEVDVVGELLEELIFDHALVKRRILAATVFTRVLDEELALADAGGGKCVGLDDVRAGLEKTAVDVADLVRAGKRVDVAVVFEIFGGALETLAARLLLGDIVGAYGGAHGAVNDRDALGKEAAEGDFGGGDERCLGSGHERKGGW